MDARLPWIRVDEQKPELDERVFVWRPGHGAAVDRLTDVKWRDKDGSGKNGPWQKEIMWCGSPTMWNMVCLPIDFYSHWCPINGPDDDESEPDYRRPEVDGITLRREIAK